MESWRRELYTNELYHHGIPGQKWGVRRYQNPDGSVTAAGANRYYEGGGSGHVRWGLAKGERDVTGATQYVSKSSSENRGRWDISKSRHEAMSDDAPRRGGGGGGNGGSGSGEEEKRETTVADAQAIVDKVKSDREAWIQSLKEKAANRKPAAKEEKEKKSSSKSAKQDTGANMTAEEVADAVAKILGIDISEEAKTEEPSQPTVENIETKPEENPEPEEKEEDNLSEEDEEELSGYMVDPITEKVYRVDEESGDAYAVDPATGEMSKEPVKLQSNKLEGLVSSIRAGAENFRQAFTTVLGNIRAAREERKAAEAERQSAAKNAMVDSDAAKLKSISKAEKNEKKKTVIEENLKKKQQRTLHTKD